MEKGTLSPGRYNAITDVAGITVGHHEATDYGRLTGVTVVRTPPYTVAGVDVRGGAPGTRETALLDPLCANPGVNAISLSGGSAYGLSTADGVMRYLEERGEGYEVGRQVVPIVPTAIIYDLGRGGDSKARPGPEWGYEAIAAATGGQVDQGNVGGGTGATAGGLKGGVGTASVVLEDGTTVAALVVVNAAGTTVTDDGALLGAAYGLDDEFPESTVPSMHSRPKSDISVDKLMSNTTIGVVATDATLDKAAANRLAMCGHDGMARAIYPSHTLGDGDTLFALATGRDGDGHGELRVNEKEDVDKRRKLNMILSAGADVVARAVAHAMLAAESVRGIPSYRDAHGCE